MSESSVEHVLKLGQQFETARSEAIAHLLDHIKSSEESLKALGYEGDARVAAKKRSAKPCSKCGEKGHDARAHRGDAKARAERQPPE